ncbi:MAG TPA: DUF2381 family protein [Myxococcaceae bacterium]|nr:DUF2381 family protein [Myxococcaceae bacterium]
MYARCWTVRLWVLLVCLMAGARAGAAGRESRWGTVLVVGGSEEAPPVLYVAERTATLVDFEELRGPRAAVPPELRGSVEVLPFGERGLVVSPLRKLEEGERLLLPVTGRMEDGREVTLTLALGARRDVVDAEVRVPRRGESSEVTGVLLASHGMDGSRPRLGLFVRGGEERTEAYAGDIWAFVESVLLLDRHLFVTVAVHPFGPDSEPWRLIRVRLEPRCREGTGTDVEALSVVSTSTRRGKQQLHLFSTLLPEGAECVELVLEEDGPRTLHFRGVRLPR